MYNEITLLLFATAIIGVFALRLKQPVIVAYILIGIVAGPSVLDWVSAHEPMELLAEIGVTILLFVVGLKLDVNQIRQLGPVALATGLGQLAFTIVFGFLICVAMEISELSIIFVAMGVSLGHVDPAALGLVTLVGLVTITLSTYMILYSHRLHAWLEPWLGLFERADPWRENSYDEPVDQVDVIVFGMGRYGLRLSRQLCDAGLRVVGVDFDPEVLSREKGSAVHVMFGDAGDEDFVASLPITGARQVVSCLRDPGLDLQLTGHLRRQGYEGAIAVTAHSRREGERLVAAGADTVFLPFHDAADHAAQRIGEMLARPHA